MFGSLGAGGDTVGVVLPDVLPEGVDQILAIGGRQSRDQIWVAFVRQNAAPDLLTRRAHAVGVVDHPNAVFLIDHDVL